MNEMPHSDICELTDYMEDHFPCAARYLAGCDRGYRWYRSAQDFHRFVNWWTA